MKKIFIYFFLFLLSCNSVTEKAIHYNNKLVYNQNILIKLMDNIDLCLKDTACDVKFFYDSAVKLNTILIEEAVNLEPFEGDTMFKYKYKQLLYEYLLVLQKNYKKIIDLHKLLEKKIYSINDDSLTKILTIFKELYDDLNNRIEKVNLDFKEYQKKFAEKYNFKLEY